MDFKWIIFEKEEGVAKITLNRPPLNILNIEMMGEINKALESLQEDNLKLLVFAAEGKAFSAGVDVAEHTAERVEEMIDVFHRMFRLLASLRCPTLAVVAGAALGGGCELATFCDLVIASERATFGQPEIKVGVFPPIAALIFPRIMPRKKALELLLSGETIEAREALSLGLVNRVVPLEELEAEVDDLIKNFRQKSAIVMQLAKRAVYESLGLEFEPALKRIEEIYLHSLMRTADAQEGLQAFLEKRAPQWEDR